MHATLRPKENILLIAVYLMAGSLILLLIPTPLVLWPVGISVFFGISCGICQRYAVRERMTEMLAAKTAMQVRAVLMSSAWGRAAVYGLYCSVLARAIVSIAIFFPVPTQVLAAWVIGYLAERAVRETITLPTTMELAKAESAPNSPEPPPS